MSLVDKEDNRIESHETVVWDDAYRRGGNILFYPDEEIIKFINIYIRKRHGINEFEDKFSLLNAQNSRFASLDLGCGIGRHIRFLDEFNLNPYGIDLSGHAIAIGKEWMRSLGRDDLAERMQIASVSELPFENDFFSICVSSGVLDSMTRETALLGIKEVRRVLKRDGLMYLNLIMKENEFDGDEVVEAGYEEGTIQSYFTVDSIKKYLEGFEIIEFKIISTTNEKGHLNDKRAHLIIRNSK